MEAHPQTLREGIDPFSPERSSQIYQLRHICLFTEVVMLTAMQILAGTVPYSLVPQDPGEDVDASYARGLNKIWHVHRVSSSIVIWIVVDICQFGHRPAVEPFQVRVAPE